MKKLARKALVIAAVAGLVYGAGAETTFEAAESVWPKGLATEMNTLIAFRAPFELKAGETPVLKMVAWYSYRVTLNGAFVGFGPARGPKGLFRPDEWNLAKAAKPGRNELCVEVAGYNVPNFYLMEQPPFFKAEVVCGEDVRAATRRTGGGFAATRQPRVQRVPRYSFQRTFAEAYRLPAPAQPPALALAAAPEPALVKRRAPYPDFEVNPRMTPVSFAKVRYDETAPVRTDRALSLPGKAPTFKGFPLADLELNVSFLAQRLVSSDRRPATEAEKTAASFAFKAGASMVFDNGLNDTGFPGLRVEVKEPGRLVLQFDEILSANGEARGVRRYGDCNALVWDFAEPGVYEVDAFEPYTMRYVELDVVSGEMVVSAPRFRSYKNPTAKRAQFRASDPTLVEIFDAARETFRQNAVDVFMDCPSRERAGWNCDAFFTAPAATLLTGSFALERVFEENLALLPAFDDIPDGAIPMCYPADHRERGYIPNWGMWFVLETEEYLRRTGDRALVDALRPRLEKFVTFLWKYRNGDGLLERLPGWVFVEWSRANDLVQDVSYPSNMTWADTLDAMGRLYGRKDLAAEAASVRETVRRQSWTGAWFCDNAVRQKDGSLRLSGECTETCQYYAFFHRVATPETHPALWKRLLMEFGPSRYDPADRKKMLRHPEIWPSNAFIGNYLRLKLLERAGRGRQILDETKGYFKYMADLTGTLWEHDRTNASCNHGFASYAAVLLVRNVLGLEIDHLKKTVTVRPTDVDLDFCGVTLPVSGGEIVYDWTKVNGRREETFAAPPGWRLVLGEAAKVSERQGAAFVMRFDDNKPVSQWREVAEIFEAIGGRCSFAVNAATLDDAQWAALRDLSARGHEIMDHTAQHAVFKLLCATADEAAWHRPMAFYDHVEQGGRLVLCRPEIDLGCPANVRVQAAMTNGVLRSEDPAFLRLQGVGRKFHVPSVGKTYGLGKDCGYGLFRKGPEQRCSDFWGRWTSDSFGPCEIVILADAAVQPSLDLLRAQARASVSLFAAHGLPPPKTWIRPGGWESGVAGRRMKAVYGDEFGYAVADSTLTQGLPKGSPWCRRSDFEFFDRVPDVDKVYGRVAEAVARGQSFAYISHQWTKDRAQFLAQCRAFAARLKAGGIPLTTYSHIAEDDASSKRAERKRGM